MQIKITYCSSSCMGSKLVRTRSESSCWVAERWIYNCQACCSKKWLRRRDPLRSISILSIFLKQSQTWSGESKCSIWARLAMISRSGHWSWRMRKAQPLTTLTCWWWVRPTSGSRCACVGYSDHRNCWLLAKVTFVAGVKLISKKWLLKE